MSQSSSKSLTIWTAINSIAVVIALLFSSLIPQIQNIFKKESLKIDITNRCSISHYFGSIDLSITLDIYNNGGVPLSIKKIICLLQSPDETYFDLKAQRYVSLIRTSSFTENPSIPWRAIDIEPKEGWIRSVSFYKDYTESEDDEIDEIEQKTSDNLKDKSMKYYKSGYNKPFVYEVDSQIVEKGKAIFNKNFRMKKGNYKVLIAISTTSGNKYIKGYEFTLYDRQLNILTNIPENYRYGNYDNRISAMIKFRPISDNEANQLFDIGISKLGLQEKHN